MVKFKVLFIFLFLSVAILSGWAQPVIGEWTDYQSYASAKNVTDTGDKIYCVTEGGLFSFNKKDNSIHKMSGINGLSDVGVRRVAYSKENNLLLIAYENANIDLLIDNQVFNLSDIRRKQISGDKSINNVLFAGNLAYLSCGFGIVVINLERKEIKDTYFIGQEGGYVNVNDLATDGTFLYAATSNGLYKASASEPNLQNYNNWVPQTNIPHSGNKFSKIEAFHGKIIATYTPYSDEWSMDEVYQMEGDVWTRVFSEITYVSDVTSMGNFLVFSGREEVRVYNENFDLVRTVDSFLSAANIEINLSPSSAVIDDQNVLWISDHSKGLIKVGTQTENILPDGPVNNRVFSLTSNGKDLWVAAGGWDDAWGNLNIQPQFQLNREGKWSVFDRTVFPASNNFSDIVCIAVDPKNPDHVFAGSWGGGVLEFRDGQFFNRYDNFNSSLQTQLPAQPNEPYVRIGGMDFDSKGNLWVTNTGVNNVLSVFDFTNTPNGEWESFSLSGIANQFSIGKVVVTQNDDKWVMIPRGKGHELYVLNSTNDVAKEQRLIAYFSNGNKEEVFTPMTDIYSLAEDQDGELWIGTSMGVAVFSNPQQIWEDQPMYATRPGLNLQDTFFHPLLENEIVTAIAVDGANRKWIGTRNSGVFLISDDGETELEHFDTENSPLPRNDVSDIAINHNTGEVFIGTSAGLISYMGQATKANDVFADVYVYPNPVRETYEGPIVVTGLMEDTDVKITDVSGNLVYRTNSLGGQAVWDGKNLNGNRCSTGVYLVFMNDPTGDQTKVTKLLFIH